MPAPTNGCQAPPSSCSSHQVAAVLPEGIHRLARMTRIGDSEFSPQADTRPDVISKSPLINRSLLN